MNPRNPVFFCLLVSALALLFFTAGAARAVEVITIGGTGSASPLLESLGQAYQAQRPEARVRVVLPPMGSGAAIRAVMAGAIDLAAPAKPLNRAEWEQGGRYWELGQTPMAIVTREPNRLDNMTLERLADIYAARTTSWPDGASIRLVLRPEDEWDTKALRKLSPAMNQAVESALARPGVPEPNNDLDNADLLERTRGALGVTNLALIVGQSRRLFTVPVNGVAPTLDNLARGAYPYAKPLYLAHGPALSFQARDFLDFILSAQGQEILRRQGYLPGVSKQ